MTVVKKISVFFLTLLLSSALFISCQKEDSFTSNTSVDGNLSGDNLETDSRDGYDCDEEDFEEMDDCFTINYPISISTSDGIVYTVNSDDEVEALYDELPEDAEILFNYPIDVTLLEDGTVLTLADDEAVDELFEACFGDAYHCDEDEYDALEECFNLVFPLSVALPNGDIVMVNSEEDIDALYDTLSEEEDLELVYPLQVELELDNSTVTVNSEEEIEVLLDTCEEAYEEEEGEEEDHGCDEEDFELFEDCFTIVYPFSVTMEDGQVIELSDEEAVEALMDTLEEEGVEVELNFPIQVTLVSDGSTVSLADEEALDELLESCE